MQSWGTASAWGVRVAFRWRWSREQKGSTTRNWGRGQKSQAGVKRITQTERSRTAEKRQRDAKKDSPGFSVEQMMRKVMPSRRDEAAGQPASCLISNQIASEFPFAPIVCSNWIGDQAVSSMTTSRLFPFGCALFSLLATQAFTLSCAQKLM